MLQNTTAIITGGTRGIGRAIALLFAQNGANVAVNYASSSAAAEQLKSEVEVLGVEFYSAKCDVSNNDEVQTFVENCIERFGRIDILVNNAGITRDKLVLKMTSEDFNDVINTNLGGAFNMAKAITPHMMKNRAGRIINMSSIMGLLGNAGQANYSAAKAGIIGLTKAMAKELGGRNILVNAIAPGFIETDMTAQMPENARAAVVGKISLKRTAQPLEVAKVALFLASDLSSYVSGQVIVVDGCVN
ncbi:MAG: 3-oxoacyl-[acyl-carrier-protein] reductase [Clostridiales bacterium]|jgi:3-oxoacyl-[acyl-carrier protein] reductase|nr:3-oxoacyl-[acyl-carrier-protein] reductase [Clostridiales bacterium]